MLELMTHWIRFVIIYSKSIWSRLLCHWHMAWVRSPRSCVWFLSPDFPRPSVWGSGTSPVKLIPWGYTHQLKQKCIWSRIVQLEENSNWRKLDKKNDYGCYVDYMEGAQQVFLRQGRFGVVPYGEEQISGEDQISCCFLGFCSSCILRRPYWSADLKLERDCSISFFLDRIVCLCCYASLLIRCVFLGLVFLCELVGIALLCCKPFNDS